MLKHNLPETSSPLSAPRAEADTSAHSPTEIETSSATFIEKSISDYLDQVTSSLVGTLPEAEISGRRAEMHSHIVAMIDARIELGDTPEIALKETLSQFGQSRNLKTEWKVATQEKPVLQEYIRCAKIAFPGFTVSYLLGIVVFNLFLWCMISIHMVQQWSPIEESLLILVPIGLGGMTSWLMNHRLKKSWFTMFGFAQMVPCMLVYPHLIASNSVSQNWGQMTAGVLVVNVFFLLLTYSVSFLSTQLRDVLLPKLGLRLKSDSSNEVSFFKNKA